MTTSFNARLSIATLCITLSFDARADPAKTFFIHTDHLDTPRLISEKSGAAVWAWDSDAFGVGAPTEQTTAGGKFVNNLRFPGQYADIETGLYYNYFRDYEPQTGRYVQSDPIGLDGGINTYSYALGNPVKFTDPTGEIVPLVVVAACSGGGCAALLAATGAAIWWAATHQPKASGNDRELQQSIEREANRREYKSYCDDPPPPGGNQCDDAQNELRNAERCKAARIENTRKWWQGVDDKHSSQMSINLDRRIANAKRAVERKCPPSC